MARDVYTNTEADARSFEARYASAPYSNDAPDARELAEDFAPKPFYSRDGVFTTTVSDDPWVVPGATHEEPF